MKKQLLPTLAILLVGMLTSNLLAVDIYLDFEDTNSRFAIDKLTEDGSQDGRFVNAVSTTPVGAPFGNRAALFEEPEEQEGVPPFSTLEIPDTVFDEDFSLTVAMHVENREDNLDFTRLFSTFQGTGGLVPERSIFLDHDPSGSTIPGIRAIINSTVVQTDFVPDGMSDPGYHHYAMTIEDGEVVVYFDGEEVISDFVGVGYSNDFMNIHIGEDPHDGGGSANEQLIGNFDEVLVIERALSANDISLLADGNLVSSVVTPNGNERAVYYDFEGDTGKTFSDRFTADGAQNGISHRKVRVDETATHAKLGSGSAQIEHPVSEESSIFSQIDLGEVGNLGEQFTLSAVVNVSGGGFPFDGLTRLFSSFKGTGPIGPEELVFDFDPFASIENIGMRLLLPGGESVMSDVTFSTNEDHLLTAVYDDGSVNLYLDGELVGEGDASFGEIDLGTTPLKIGEDSGGIVNENYIGIMDDVLVLSRALNENDVAQLAAVGAAEFLGLGGVTGDFNGDGLLDVADINRLSAESAAGNHPPEFDLDNDGFVNASDISVWVRDLKQTWLGDANLDGEFNSTDLVVVFAAGLFELDQDATWEQGDWNGDLRFGSGDLVTAFVDGGYEQGTRGAQAVPEPGSLMLFGIAFLGFLANRRTNRR